MKSYVTLLSTESYLPGVLALHEALRRVKSAHGLLVCLSAGVPQRVVDRLKSAGLNTHLLPPDLLASSDMAQSNRDAGAAHWTYTFDKLHLFGLTQYTKLVYIDSDMLVTANIDELFDQPHAAAVPAGMLFYPDWNRLNSGLMVIQPEAGLPQRIAATLAAARAQAGERGVKGVGDQDLINAFYADWPSRQALHLDSGYNTFLEHLDAHVAEHGYHVPGDGNGAGRPVKVIHFIGNTKPWMPGATLRHYKDMLSRKGSTLHARRAFKRYRQLIRDWGC